MASIATAATGYRFAAIATLAIGAFALTAIATVATSATILADVLATGYFAISCLFVAIGFRVSTTGMTTVLGVVARIYDGNVACGAATGDSESNSE